MDKKELTEALELYKGDIEKLFNDLKTANDEEKAEIQTKLNDAQTMRDTMQEQLDQIATDLKNQKLARKAKEEALNDMEAAIKQLFGSKEFKEAKEAGFPHKKNIFNLKVISKSCRSTA